MNFYNHIELEVKKIIFSILGDTGNLDAVSDLRLQHHLIHSLGADSLDYIEIAMALEERFEFDLPDYVYMNWETISDVVRYVYEQKK